DRAGVPEVAMAVNSGTESARALNPSLNLVAEDERGDEIAARNPELLGKRQRWRQHVNCRMARRPAAFVKLEERSGRCVEEGRRPRRGGWEARAYDSCR